MAAAPPPYPMLAEPYGAGAAGIWSLDGARLVELERFDVGPSVVLVPAEHVLLLTADLPLPNPRRRAEALPFAIEDLIAAPLASVHVALGAETTPRRHVAGVVDQGVMAGWVQRLAAAGLARAAIVPDAVALPVPPAGGWSVNLAGARAIVRTSDGTGFALPAALLEAAWTAASEPRCTAFGDALPAAMGGGMAELAPAPLAARLIAPALDLRQGAYRRARKATTPLLRRLAWAISVGAIAHGLIAAADTLALDRAADASAAATRTLLAQVAPGTPADADLATAVATALPAGGGAPSAFLPLLARVTGALRPLGSAATLRSLAFDATAGTMAIEVEAADIPGLQRVGQALQAGGLGTESGAASADQGKAVGAFLIRGIR